MGRGNEHFCMGRVDDRMDCREGNRLSQQGYGGRWLPLARPLSGLCPASVPCLSADADARREMRTETQPDESAIPTHTILKTNTYIRDTIPPGLARPLLSPGNEWLQVPMRSIRVIL